MISDKKIIGYKDLSELRSKATKEGKTIVFASGCYDILHLGHIVHFDFCKKQGDILVITIGNDKTVRELKGEGRPINNELYRARTLAAICYIDYVVISEEFGKMDHDESIKLLRPDILVLNDNDSAIEAKRKLVSENGGKLVLRDFDFPSREDVLSTTKIADQIKKA